MSNSYELLFSFYRINLLAFIVFVLWIGGIGVRVRG